MYDNDNGTWRGFKPFGPPSQLPGGTKVKPAEFRNGVPVAGSVDGQTETRPSRDFMTNALNKDFDKVWKQSTKK